MGNKGMTKVSKVFKIFPIFVKDVSYINIYTYPKSFNNILKIYLLYYM